MFYLNVYLNYFECIFVCKCNSATLLAIRDYYNIIIYYLLIFLLFIGYFIDILNKNTLKLRDFIIMFSLAFGNFYIMAVNYLSLG